MKTIRVLRPPYCLVEIQRPEHPSEPLNVPEPLRPDACPVLTTVTPL